MTRTGASARSPQPLLLGVVIGAVIVCALSLLLSWRPGVAVATPQQQARDTALAAPTGSCLTWSSPHAEDLHQVPCSAPHLFEVVGSVPIAGAQPPGAAQLQQLGTQQCTAAATGYLGRLDPQGKYTVGALSPDQRQWANGMHKLHCGLRAATPSGKLLSTTGSVRDQGQSNVYPAGTCLAITPNGAAGDPAKCGDAHAFEILGVVDLKPLLGNDYPSTADQQAKLVTACQQVAKRYTGGRDLDALHLTLTWDTRDKTSWDAGSTRVNCKVGAPKSDGSGLRPISGSIKAQ